MKTATHHRPLLRTAFAVLTAVPLIAASWVTGPAAGQCGLPDDGLIHLPPYYTGPAMVTPPGVGESLFDLAFGCPVRRLTDGPTGPGEPLGAGHHYATVSPFNRDASLVLVEKASPVGNFILDRHGHLVRSGFGVFPWMEPRWSPTDPYLLYYHSNPVGPIDPGGGVLLNKIFVYDVRTGTSSEWFSADDYFRINLGQKAGGTPNGETDVSPHGMVVLGGNTDTDVFAPFTRFRLLDLINRVLGDEIHGGPTTGLLDQPEVFVDWCAATPLTDNIVCRFDRNTEPEFHRFELFKGFAGEYRGVQYASGEYIATVAGFTGHADRGLDLTDNDGDGAHDEVLVAVNNSAPPDAAGNGCTPPGVEKIRIPDGHRTCLLDDYPRGTAHISINSSVDGAGAPTHPWVLVSTYTPQDGTQDFELGQQWERNWGRYYNELVLIRLDGGETRRLAHHRSRRDPDDGLPSNNCNEARCIPGGTPDCGNAIDRVHEAAPVAALDGSGRYALFNSNFALTPFQEPPFDLPCMVYSDAYLIDTETACDDDGVCEEGETCRSCPGDCIGAPDCGDGVCEAGDGEDCTSCPVDCDRVGQTCCGPVTGEDQLCAEINHCNSGGAVCTDTPGFCCGDGVCAAGESATTCAPDCPPAPPLCPGGAAEGATVVFPQPREIFPDGPGVLGDNYVGIPALSPLNDFPGDGSRNGFQQLCDLFGLRGTPSSLVQFDPENGFVHTFNCDQAVAPPFLPCQGVLIQTFGVASPIVGTIPVGDGGAGEGVEGSWLYPVWADVADPRGDHLFGIPLTLVSTSPETLCQELGLPAGAQVLQFLAGVGNINTHLCGQVPVFSLRPGEAVRISVPGTAGQKVGEGRVTIE